ncbi:unnamed protein product [Darwinula stevensoni]|uniref:Phenazine biosynthesis-like domain-containing protein n=1 Tax=Darwinula stevensoni TaxID=69355 RepID=A0A7R9AHT7_9CRUS|nr:unnamed protein product [Darwinula stevensoni]CAG0905160.1 unnamed protein product [Darwinula stevensoni]
MYIILCLGAAHTVLTPYWSGKLGGKQEMFTHQCSKRGGDLDLKFRGLNAVAVALTGLSLTGVGVLVLPSRFCEVSGPVSTGLKNRLEMQSDESNAKLGVSLPIFIVDTFTGQPFSGNPAAVCLVDGLNDIPDTMKQSMAAELNLTETAIVTKIRIKDGFDSAPLFRLRWFTPTNEVALCGHATLAAAAVLFFCCNNPNERLEFETMSGVLGVRKQGRSIVLSFPGHKPKSLNAMLRKEAKPLVKEILKDLEPADLAYCFKTKNLLIRLEDSCSRTMLEELEVSPKKMMSLHDGSLFIGVILTVKGGEAYEGYDFFSRYFSPWDGIPEDPATGLTHTVLAPYWSEQLSGKQVLHAYQCSKRGGDLNLKVRGSRVEIGGHFHVIVKGVIHL